MSIRSMEPRAGATADRTFHVEGLCCSLEAKQIERHVGALPGVDGLAIDIVGRTLAVQGTVDPRQVERTLAGLGMKGTHLADPGTEAEPAARDSVGSEPGSRKVSARDWLPSASTLLTGVAGALFLMGAALALLSPGSLAGRAAFLASTAVGAARILPRAARSLRVRSLDMHVLVAVAGLGAVAIGELGEAAALYFLFAVAQALEARSLERVRRSIRSLVEEAPRVARVLRDGREVSIPTGEVAVGDVVVVHPGEKVPVDGVVVSGSSAVNEAAITGEPVPAEKSGGSTVFAGTLNGHGALEVRTTRAPGDTTLARIVHAVEEARANRAPAEAFIDRFARVYTPAVIGIAALIFLVPPTLGFGTWGDWLYRALVMLVIACPCALVISTPVTIVSALAGAARRGILIKGGAALENLARVDVVALDKTGTLTAGEPAVAEIIGLGDASPAEIVARAASAELRSGHPLGRAVVRHARRHGFRIEPPESSETLPGLGVRARVEGEEVFAGGRRLFNELGWIDERVSRVVERLEEQAQTAVLVGTAEGPIGVIGLADRLRPGAVGAVAGLRDLGVRGIAVLTGDAEPAARAVTAPLAPDHVLAGLLPEEKAAAVRDLERDAHVAFVGDGINDAPALASATVGVAMAAAGTDVALESADVALMTDDLSRLPLAIRLARKASAIVRQNVAFALATKVAMAALAVAGFAALWMAVAADLGATLVVTANGLRALRTR